MFHPNPGYFVSLSVMHDDWSDELGCGRHTHPVEEVGFRHEVEGGEVYWVDVVVGLEGIPFPSRSAN